MKKPTKQTITVSYHQVLEYIQGHDDLSFILVIFANDIGSIVDPHQPLNMPPNTVAMAFDVSREISAQIRAVGAGKVGELLQHINATNSKIILEDGIPF